MKNIATNNTWRETTRHGTSDFPLEFYIDDTRNFYNNDINWHWHKEFEIAYISEGNIICHINQCMYSLQPGDMIFINSGILHRFTSETYGIMPNIVFSPFFLASSGSLIYQKYIMPLEKSALPCLIFKQTETWQKQIIEICKKLFCCLSTPERNELLIRNLLSEVWLILTDHLSREQLMSASPRVPQHSQNAFLIMLQYIQTHYGANITLTDISNTANISKNTALRYFQENIGISPIEYLIQYRISQACKMLRGSSEKVSNISVSVGYDDISYFCKLFKKYVGKSPTQYRT